MKLTLKTKFMLVISIMSAFMILVGLTGLYAMKVSHEGLKHNHEKRTQGLEKIASIDKLLLINRYAVMAALADPASGKMQLSADDIERDMRAIDQLWIEFAATPMSPQTRKKADELNLLRASFDHAVTLPVIRSLRDADTRKIKEISLLSDQLKDPIISAMNSLRTLQLDVAKKEYESAEAAYVVLRNLMLATVTLGLVLAAALAYFLLHIIYRELGGEPAYAAQIARQIADGDLNVSITPAVHEESSLLVSLQQLQTGLTKAVRDMRLDTGNIARTSGQMLSNNMMLLSRLEQQSSSHKQITAATKELTSAIRQNGEKVRRTMQLVDETSELAINQGRAAGAMVSAVMHVRHASDKISDNIHVIDELAFQIDTMLLKLMVEDASTIDAEQPLVAITPEVRGLAQGIACAAKEIKNLLNDTREKLDDSSKLVSQGNAVTEQMLIAMQQVNSLMAELNTSTKMQETSIRKIKHAVSDMDYASRKDAILLGVCTTTAKLLEQQASHLAQLGGGFKLGASHRPQAQLQVVSAVATGDATPKRPNLRLVRT